MESLALVVVKVDMHIPDLTFLQKCYGRFGIFLLCKASIQLSQLSSMPPADLYNTKLKRESETWLVVSGFCFAILMHVSGLWSEKAPHL